MTQAGDPKPSSTFCEAIQQPEAESHPLQNHNWQLKTWSDLLHSSTAAQQRVLFSPRNS